MSDWLVCLEDCPKLVELKKEIDKYNIREELLEELGAWLRNVYWDKLYDYENLQISIYLSPKEKEIWWFHGVANWQRQEYCRKSGWKLLLKEFLKDVYPKGYIWRLDEDKSLDATEYISDEDAELIKQYMLEIEGE